MVSEQPWVGIAKLAAHQGVAKVTVYHRWVDTQGLPAHRIGRLFRFRLSQIGEWVEDSTDHVATSRK
ncbi:MAG: helix-turn-helix domain-containing protein [bacterium]|nr:helix-turn-helix domain-containing protein [bacterium]